MSLLVNIQDAKTRLSKILRRAEAGEDVVIARDGVPVVRLVPVVKAPPRPAGFVHGVVTDEFFKPLPEEELRRWE